KPTALPARVWASGGKADPARVDAVAHRLATPASNVCGEVETCGTGCRQVPVRLAPNRAATSTTTTQSRTAYARYQSASCSGETADGLSTTSEPVEVACRSWAPSTLPVFA